MMPLFCIFEKCVEDIDVIDVVARWLEVFVDEKE